MELTLHEREIPVHIQISHIVCFCFCFVVLFLNLVVFYATTAYELEVLSLHVTLVAYWTIIDDYTTKVWLYAC